MTAEPSGGQAAAVPVAAVSGVDIAGIAAAVAAQLGIERTTAPDVGSAGIDEIGTAIIGGSGPVHSGGGAQMNFAGQDNDFAFYLAQGRRVSDWGVTPVRLEWLQRRFVAPSNFDLAVSRLTQPGGLAILSGPAGSGRRTAALMLLCADSGAQTQVRLVPPELERQAAEADRRTFGGEDVKAGDRLLLDLSEVDEESFVQLQDYLHALQPALVSRQAKLVVIVPAAYDATLRSDFVSSLVEIGRPDGVKVVVSHLAAEGVACQSGLVEFRERFATDSMARLERLVRRTVEVRRKRPAGHVEQWLEEAINVEVQRRQKVERVVNTADDARSRTLLLTAAILDGVPAHTVFAAQQQLLDILRTDDEKPPNPIEMTGVDKAIEMLDVGLQITPGGRLRFADPDFSQVVAQYFWDQLPWLRPKLIAWATQLVRAGDLDVSERSAVALRIGDQCRRTRRAELALSLVEAWASDRRWSVRSTAYQLVGELLDDERTATQTRQSLYWWARDTRLSPRLAEIVIAACVEVVAATYPDQAVVRLSWLTRHENATVRSNARRALCTVADDPPRRLLVMDLLLEGGRFQPTTFAAVAAPDRLPMFLGTEAINRIGQGWRRVLIATDPDRRSACLRPWLSTHADLLRSQQAESARRLLGLLGSICGQERDLLDALFNANRDWLEHASGDQADRLRTARMVEQAIRNHKRLAGTGLREVGT